eukprot:CAMPEP_0181073248 /NCGR_PEP_ID=MMETSP1070-20121207/28983_1 /TAXON_ID=265543 /ORGANISM="Minutocellus polymorphus, Strain NH13" /LENGTH=111 /DNA_ID=CAMNT_0023154317 /DNA_START=503 /DNA_END=838 /DNA_ORIENTATION=-
MREILEHRSDATAMSKVDGYIHRPNRSPERRKTTKGWELLVEWADGHVSWTRLADLKEAYPDQVAEHAKIQGELRNPTGEVGNPENDASSVNHRFPCLSLSLTTITIITIR